MYHNVPNMILPVFQETKLKRQTRCCGEGKVFFMQAQIFPDESDCRCTFLMFFVRNKQTVLKFLKQTKNCVWDDIFQDAFQPHYSWIFYSPLTQH